MLQEMLTIHVSVAFNPTVSVIVNWKTKTAPLGPTSGAVKLGYIVAEPDNGIGVPAVWIH